MWFKRKNRNFPLPYKFYSAKLVQTGTAAPAATVLLNDGVGTIVWTRTGAGVYRGTLVGAFTNNKTDLRLSNQINLVSGNQFTLSRISADVIEIVSKVVTAGVGTNTDALLGVLDNVIEIKVYV